MTEDEFLKAGAPEAPAAPQGPAPPGTLGEQDFLNATALPSAAGERSLGGRALHSAEVFGSGLVEGALSPIDLLASAGNWAAGKGGYRDVLPVPGEMLRPYLATPEGTGEKLLYGAGSGIGSLVLP